MDVVDVLFADWSTGVTDVDGDWPIGVLNHNVVVMLLPLTGTICGVNRSVVPLWGKVVVNDVLDVVGCVSID